MTIASGQLATAADVAAGIGGAQTIATAASATAAAAKNVATAASALATTAADTATTASALATTATSDLTTVKTTTTANQSDLITVKAAQTAEQTARVALQVMLDALTNRVTVLETAVPPPAVPNAVATFALGATTNTTQVLNWTAPGSGAALTFYDTRYKLAGTATWSAGPSVAVGTLTATVTALTSPANYDYSVVTRNSAGPGGASATLTKSTTTSFTPSPANTTIPNATSITMDDGGVVTVVAGVIYLDPLGAPANAPMGSTNSVILVLKHTDGRIFQENSFLDWWYWDPTKVDPWTFASDPRVVTPPSGGPTPPAQAAAQGFIIRTLGPNVTLGSNWFVREGTNVQNGDGSMTTFGTGGFNACVQTALMAGGGNFSGTAFGGGAYFEATLKWSGTTTQAGGGWPGWWSNDVEMQADEFGAAVHWPGQSGSTLIWFEPDFMEAFSEGGYGTAFHNWYSNNGGTDRPDVQAMPPSYTFPAGFDHNTYHKYGWLWVPATPTTQGLAAAYIDGVEWQRVRWPYVTGTVSYPPVLSNGVISTGGLMDNRHLYLILGSGPNNPVTVSSVEVWQKSAASNLTR